MADKSEFHKDNWGAFGENEDWWYLIVSDDAPLQVMHDWSYVNAYKVSQKNKGQELYSIEEFMEGDHDPYAKKKLQKRLNNRGLALAYGLPDILYKT